MELKKEFSDIGSIVKVLLKHIDIQRVYIKICLDNRYPGELCVGVFFYNAVHPEVVYTWIPTKVQHLHIPDHICMPYVLQKKIRNIRTPLTRKGI